MIGDVELVSIQWAGTCNFCGGSHWVIGVVVERLDSLTYLVQVELGVFWRHHIDHLRPAADG